MKKRKILITGGTGFIGYHLAKKCLKLNWKVDSISTKLPSIRRKLKKVNYIILDISKKNLFRNLSQDYDYVVNLAGYVDHSKSNQIVKTHFNGCKNLANYFLNTEIKKFVQIGSSIEYGKEKSPQKENNKKFKKTSSVYGSAKLLSTKYLLNLKKKYNFPSVILRLYLIYGPNQDANRIIPITIINSVQNNKFDCSKGKQLRDFLYIDDLINAIIKTLRGRNSVGQIINIGSGKPISIKKLILNICRLAKGGRPQFGKISLRGDEIDKLYPNITKSTKLLNWKPKISLKNGLKKTIKYFKKLK